MVESIPGRAPLEITSLTHSLTHSITHYKLAGPPACRSAGHKPNLLHCTWQAVKHHRVGGWMDGTSSAPHTKTDTPVGLEMDLEESNGRDWDSAGNRGGGSES